MDELQSLLIAFREETSLITKVAIAAGVRLPVHQVKAPGLLRVGASSAWRMHPPSVKPKTTRPNTNPSARGKEVPTLKPPSNSKYHKDLIESLHNPQRGFRITKAG